MRNFIFAIAFFMSGFHSFAQNHNFDYDYLYLPRDTDGSVFYEKVVDASGKSASDLFSDARIWFLETFKYSKEVIQYEDKDAGIISGNGMINLELLSLGYIVQKPFYFSLRIEVKDGRYRYHISNITIDQTSSAVSQGPIESFFSEEWMYNRRGKPRKVMFEWYDEYEDAIIALERSLSENLINKSSEDDW